MLIKAALGSLIPPDSPVCHNDYVYYILRKRWTGMDVAHGCLSGNKIFSYMISASAMCSKNLA